MAFNFVASAQNNGIVFTYNNNKNALYVYREDGEIKEEEVKEEEIVEGTKLERLTKKIISYYIKLGGLILLELLLVANVKAKMSDIWFLYIMGIIIYIHCVVIFIVQDSMKTSISMKQYHSAEHMVFNANSLTIGIEELKKCSIYANDCSRNSHVIEILQITMIGFLTNVFCNRLLLERNLYFYVGTYILYVVALNVIYKIIFYMARIGVYNHIFQPLFLEKPTDEQLELAIYGLKRVKELEQQNSN